MVMVRAKASIENTGSPVEHHFLHEKRLPLRVENNFSGQGLPTDKDSHYHPERHAPSSNCMGRHPEVNHFAHDLTLKSRRMCSRATGIDRVPRANLQRVAAKVLGGREGCRRGPVRDGDPQAHRSPHTTSLHSLCAVNCIFAASLTGWSYIKIFQCKLRVCR